MVVDAVPATAIDTATDQNGEYEVTAFYYRVNGQVYGAKSKVGWLPYATPRFPHVDWSRLKADLDASGQKRLPIDIVYAASSPRIFVVPKYAARPSYYGPGRIFFYALRSAVLLICWAVWCVGLVSLLADPLLVSRRSGHPQLGDFLREPHACGGRHPPPLRRS